MAGLLAQLLDGAGGVVGIRANLVPYEVEARLAGGAEIRRYGPRGVAEVAMGAGMAGRGDAFGLLARYIFGGNRGGRRLAMTAPVALRPAGEALPMTAPVALTGGAVPAMRFFLPQGMTAAGAPAPLDSRVRVFDLPAETLAALRYAGSTGEAALAAKRAALLRVLAADPGWQAAGEPVDWLYDPPWTIPPLRRNEAVVAASRR